MLYGLNTSFAEEGSMMKDSNTSCPFHGSAFRPEICSDCARLARTAPKERLIQLDPRDSGRLERIVRTDARGREQVSFRLVGDEIERPEHATQPWGQIWD